MLLPTDNALNISIATLLLWLLFFIANALYNLFLHPLHRFPGPILNAASGLPYTYHLLRGHLAKPYQGQIHAKYGKVVRVSPNRLSFIDADAWKDINGYKGAGGQNLKDPGLFMPDPEGFPKPIVTADDVEHQRQRKMLAPGFNGRAVAEQEGTVTGYVNALIRGLSDASSHGPQDMLAWLNWTIFDITGELTFNESFDCLKLREYHPWILFVLDFVKYGRIMGHLTGTYPGLGRLLPLMMPARAKVHHRLERRDVTTPDFISLLSRDNESNNDRLNALGIIQNAGLLVVGGSETSAAVLTGTLYLLCKTPRAYGVLASKIRNHFSDEQEIDFASCAKQEYIMAVIREGLRMYPPAPAAFDRIISDPAGQSVAGEWVPHGTLCGIPQYAAYRSPYNFKDPDKFVPERWLGDERFKDDDRDLFKPFGYGPRDCIGVNLAFAEMRLLLTRLMWNLDFSLNDPAEDWIGKQRAYALWDKIPLMLNVMPRKK